MVKNLPVRSVSYKDLTIEGWSRAAVQTYWRIPEMKLGFDLGAQPWDFMGTSTWFVSHTHLDHIACLPVYVARRRMMKMDPPTIYLPAYAVDIVHRLLAVVGRLDRGRLPCKLIGVEPGQEIEVSRELVVTVHQTFHTIPSVGYVVWERRKKLKPEYTNLTGEQIRDIRLQGTEVSEERRTPRIAYLGDSTPQGLDANPIMYEAEVLLTEVTFLAARHRSAKIHKMGHIHLDDIVARQDKFQNQLIIAAHVSSRYSSKQAEKILQKALPNMLDGRLRLWV
ncbi:MAG: metal-dependent hydrolase [Planctomycetales bacterium]|nr:metal-dependent hydrolase [Planctomycetales bacterium]